MSNRNFLLSIQALRMRTQRLSIQQGLISWVAYSWLGLASRQWKWSSALEAWLLSTGNDCEELRVSQYTGMLAGNLS